MEPLIRPEYLLLLLEQGDRSLEEIRDFSCLLLMPPATRMTCSAHYMMRRWGGAEVEPLGLRAEAEARTVQIGGWGWAGVLTDDSGGGGRSAGIFDERALEGTFDERVVEGTFEERALEHRKPPPCPAVPDLSSVHPQPRCRGLSSATHANPLQLAPSWWTRSPALAPGLTG